MLVSPPFQVYHPNIDLEGNVCLNILRLVSLYLSLPPSLSLSPPLSPSLPPPSLSLSLSLSLSPTHTHSHTHTHTYIHTFREDWKPVLTINSIIYGLQFLFLEPNPDDPLNKGESQIYFGVDLWYTSKDVTAVCPYNLTECTVRSIIICHACIVLPSPTSMVPINVCIHLSVYRCSRSLAPKQTSF